ncbi:nonsense mRNA regulator [Aphelenchoides avenae]|nr:nonsense mRNA regulator [Aphelenchus avenae]
MELVVTKAREIVTRQDEVVQIQSAQAPIQECIVDGWLRPTAVADELKINPSRARVVKFEMGAVGSSRVRILQPQGKGASALARWEVPVVSASYPLGAQANNQVVSWAFTSLPRGGSLVEVGVLKIAAESRWTAVKAHQGTAYDWILPEAYADENIGRIPRPGEPELNVLCSVRPVTEDVKDAVKSLLIKEIPCSPTEYVRDRFDTRNRSTTLAELHLEMMNLAAAISRYRVQQDLSVAKMTANIAEIKPSRLYELDVYEEALASVRDACSKQFKEGQIVIVTADPEDGESDAPPLAFKAIIVEVTEGNGKVQSPDKAKFERSMVVQRVSHVKDKVDALIAEKIQQDMKELELEMDNVNLMEGEQSQEDTKDGNDLGGAMDDDTVGMSHMEEMDDDWHWWNTSTNCSRVRITLDSERTGHEQLMRELAKVNSSFCKSDIGREFFGFEGSLTDPLPEIEARTRVAQEVTTDTSLNDEQKQFVLDVIKGGNFIHILNAPAATGKTRTLVRAALALHEIEPKATILLCCERNHATEKLIEELLRLRPDLARSLLYMVSGSHEMRQVDGTAANAYLDKFGVRGHLQGLILEAEAALRNGGEPVLTKEQLLLAKTYVYTRILDPSSMTDDKEALDLVLQKCKGIRIMIGTTGKIMPKPAVLRGVHAIFLDEANLANEFTVLAMVAPNKPRKLVAVGDPTQLGPYVVEGVRGFHAFGIRSAMDALLARMRREPHKLRVAYRSDYEIFRPFNLAVYQGKLVYGLEAGGVPKIEQSGYPLPRKGVPLILVNDKSAFQRQKSGSLLNRGQHTTARLALEAIHRHVGDIKVGVIGLYAEVRRDLEKDLKGYSRRALVELATADAYEGKDIDVVILVTSRNEGDAEFVANPRRVAVSVTRAKYLLVIIGDLDYLQGQPAWSRYLLAALTASPPVERDYVEELCFRDTKKAPKYTEGGRLLKENGSLYSSSCDLYVQWDDAGLHVEHETEQAQAEPMAQAEMMQQ